MTQAKCHKDRLQEAPNVLVHVLGAKPGQRIGVVKFYESGYYSSHADREQWTQAQVDTFVRDENAKNGISEEVADSRKAESVYHAVVKEWQKVRRFFTDVELAELQNIQ